METYEVTIFLKKLLILINKIEINYMLTRYSKTTQNKQ